MKRRFPWAVFVLVGVLVLTAGCADMSDSSGGSEELELRTYTVPEGFDRDEWYFTLSNALQAGETKIGGVTPGPSNTLVVTASPSVHEGVQKLLNELKSRGPLPKPTLGSVSVNYWIVLARPVSVGAQETQVRIAPKQLSRLEKLTPVLDQISSIQGPLEYHLLEQVQLTSVDAQQESEVRGRRVVVIQEVMADGSGGRLADVHIAMSGDRGVLHALKSRVKLEPGKFVILGQTAYNGRQGVTPSGWDPTDDLIGHSGLETQSRLEAIARHAVRRGSR